MTQYTPKQFIKDNYLLIIVSMIFILALLIVLNQQGSYQKICNEHWRNQIYSNCKDGHDLCQAVELYNNSFNIDILEDFNGSFKIGGKDNAKENT